MRQEITVRLVYRFALAGFSNEAHGTGLGLAICRMIIEHHGGQLTASSTGVSGALFQFVLPIEPSEKASPRAA
jgi:signal transduction histidine kinase